MFKRFIVDKSIRVETMWIPSNDTFRIWVKRNQDDKVFGGYFDLHSSVVGDNPHISVVVSEMHVIIQINRMKRYIKLDSLKAPKILDNFSEVIPDTLLEPDLCGNKGIDGPPGPPM